jgi:hypothetical protein
VAAYHCGQADEGIVIGIILRAVVRWHRQILQVSHARVQHMNAFPTDHTLVDGNLTLELRLRPTSRTFVLDSGSKLRPITIAVWVK